ncbi:MAG: GspH/FimT family pseudopilin [Proteobacteria bacterium]|nr:GspH/FimT family pseudopilin [Pseudomonadota bacterium]
MNKYINQKGFSLIELMVVLLIASILLAYGIPSYREFGLRQSVTNEANSLVTDLTYARVTAVKEGKSVVVLSSAGNDWSQGWDVFFDDGELTAGVPTYSAADDVMLRRSQNVSNSLTLTGVSGVVGYNNVGAASFQNSINITHLGTSKAVVVRVNASGMITSREP